MAQSNDLLSSFKPTSLAKWEEKIINDLKGKALSELDHMTKDGIQIQPHYNSENSPNQYILNKENNDWDIVHFVNLDDPHANKNALEGLKNGATSLFFYGKNKADLNELLKGVMIDIISINFKIDNPILLVQDLKLFCASNNINFNQLCGSILPLNGTNEELIDLLKDSKLKCFEINASSIDTNVDSFAKALFDLNVLIGNLNDKYSTELIASKCLVSLKIRQEYFVEIAKTRCIRLMIDRILEEYDIQTTIPVFSKVDSTNWEENDVENNLLRASTAAVAAIVGGTDSLYIPPYKNGEERVSNNVHLLLKEESFLNKVVDPSSGSYYIEYLTDELIKKSWERFQQYEALELDKNKTV